MSTVMEKETVSGLVESSAGRLENEAVFAAQLQSSPEAVRSFKKAQWEQFKELPRPSRKDEEWRYANLSGFAPEECGYVMPSTQSGEASEKEEEVLLSSNLLSDYAGRMVFCDGKLVGSVELAEELVAQGVVFTTLTEALADHFDKVMPVLEKSEAKLGSDKYHALQLAYLHSGVFLFVPKGVEIAAPFVVYHWSDQSDLATLPITILDAEANAAVDFVDFYFSTTPQGTHFPLATTFVQGAAGARVFNKSVQYLNAQSKMLQSFESVAGRDSQIKSVYINLGASKHRQETLVRIAEPGADTKVYSLAVAEEKQEFDQRTLQSHEAANAKSLLLFKNALMDQSRTIFSGLIDVKPNAQQTDAYQTNRNLLISKEAEAIAMPGLEIEANDVRCSHGATTGQIDDSELFYMLSRGIPADKARELLVLGFFEEVIEQIDSEALQDTVRTLLQKRFAKHII